MLEEVLYEGKGRLAGSRILNADEYKKEHSITVEWKFKDIEIILLGRLWTIPAGKNVTYIEEQGIITAKDGEDTETFRWYGKGTCRGQVSISFRGFVFYKTSSTNEKLVFLTNKIRQFETEIDESGNFTAKLWEWK